MGWSRWGAGGKVPWGLETGMIWGAEPSICSNPTLTGVSACCLTPASWEGPSLKAGGAKASVPAPIPSQPLAHTEPQLSSEKGSAARGSLSPCHPCPCAVPVPVLSPLATARRSLQRRLQLGLGQLQPCREPQEPVWCLEMQEKAGNVSPVPLLLLKPPQSLNDWGFLARCAL